MFKAQAFFVIRRFEVCTSAAGTTRGHICLHLLAYFSGDMLNKTAGGWPEDSNQPPASLRHPCQSETALPTSYHRASRPSKGFDKFYSCGPAGFADDDINMKNKLFKTFLISFYTLSASLVMLMAWILTILIAWSVWLARHGS